MKAISIAVLYVLIGMIATAVNVGCQFVMFKIWGDNMDLLVAIGAGTLAGLPVKYVLDKRYIFAFIPDGMLHDGRTFIVYSILGLGTTVIFWGTEFAFHLAFQSPEMKYVGACVGLAIGYAIKYQLDKTFVFCRSARSGRVAA